MLHEQTAVLHDVDSCGRQPVGDLFVANAELQPHGAWSFGEDIVYMSGHVSRAAKHVHDIEVSGDVDESAVNPLTENDRHLGVIDGDGDDLEPDGEKVLRDRERGLSLLRLGLDPQDSNALGPRQESVDVGVGVEAAPYHSMGLRYHP